MKNSTRNRATGRAGVAAAALIAAAGALAHIKNEASQFPDIEYSDARFDIVVLVGAGIVPETPVFEPDKPLSREELAHWVGLAKGLLPGGETPDTKALAAAVVGAGLMTSLDGDASFADLNALLFAGTIELDDAAATPTKAEAASFIAGRLDTDAGLALLEGRGLARGPVGKVSKVEAVKGHHGSAYIITIGGQSLPMDAHGRVANGPTDLLQWEGRVVRRSFMRGATDSASWLYLEATPPGEGLAEAAPTTMPQAVEATPADVIPAAVATGPGAAPVVATPPRDRRLLYWLIAAVIVLGGVLFFRRTRGH